MGFWGALYGGLIFATRTANFPLFGFAHDAHDFEGSLGSQVLGDNDNVDGTVKGVLYIFRNSLRLMICPVVGQMIPCNFKSVMLQYDLLLYVSAIYASEVAPTRPQCACYGTLCSRVCALVCNQSISPELEAISLSVCFEMSYQGSNAAVEAQIYPGRPSKYT